MQTIPCSSWLNRLELLWSVMNAALWCMNLSIKRTEMKRIILGVYQVQHDKGNDILVMDDFGNLVELGNLYGV